MTDLRHSCHPLLFAHSGPSLDSASGKQSLVFCSRSVSSRILRGDFCTGVCSAGQGSDGNCGWRNRRCSCSSAGNGSRPDAPLPGFSSHERLGRWREKIGQQSVLDSMCCPCGSCCQNEAAHLKLQVVCQIQRASLQSTVPRKWQAAFSCTRIQIQGGRGLKDYGNEAVDWEKSMMMHHGLGFGAPAVLQGGGRRRLGRVHSVGPGKRNWWQKILFEPIYIPDRLRDKDVVRDGYGLDDSLDPPEDEAERGRGTENGRAAEDGEAEEEAMDEIDEMLADDYKFAEWKRLNDVRNEIEEFVITGRDPDSRDWEDWLEDDFDSGSIGISQNSWYYPQADWEKNGMPRSAPRKPVRGMKRTVGELLSRMFEPQEEAEEDLMFEERVFRFTSQQTAKFVAVLLFVPTLVDYCVHDYALVPFMKRYVDTVPLVAEMLDLRKSQKLEIVREVKLERQRVRFEAEIGKAPPLSEEELPDHMRHTALDLREELRAENRSAFASILSDSLAGFTFFLLLISNPKEVAIMQMTGDRLFTNVSDTGKAFIIILLSDIFLGYHSAVGWETVIEMVLERYGFDVDQSSIYLFVATIPVIMDAFFKLWVFRYFTRLSASAAATFREMKRH